MLDRKYCPYSDNRKGIVRYLASLAGGLSYHATINSSSMNNRYDYDTNPFRNDADGSCWHSRDEKNSWISIKFNHVYVAVEAYVLRSTTNYPIGWDLQGLNRYKKWESISKIRNDSSLKSGNFGNWDTKNKALYNQLRFVMFGMRVRTNGDPDDYCFELKFIEFYGTIYKSPLKTIMYRNHHRFCVVLCLLYMIIVS